MKACRATESHVSGVEIVLEPGGAPSEGASFGGIVKFGRMKGY